MKCFNEKVKLCQNFLDKYIFIFTLWTSSTSLTLLSSAAAVVSSTLAVSATESSWILFCSTSSALANSFSLGCDSLAAAKIFLALNATSSCSRVNSAKSAALRTVAADNPSSCNADILLMICCCGCSVG